MDMFVIADSSRPTRATRGVEKKAKKQQEETDAVMQGFFLFNIYVY